MRACKWGTRLVMIAVLVWMAGSSPAGAYDARYYDTLNFDFGADAVAYDYGNLNQSPCIECCYCDQYGFQAAFPKVNPVPKPGPYVDSAGIPYSWDYPDTLETYRIAHSRASPVSFLIGTDSTFGLHDGNQYGASLYPDTIPYTLYYLNDGDAAYEEPLPPASQYIPLEFMWMDIECSDESHIPCHYPGSDSWRPAGEVAAQIDAEVLEAAAWGKYYFPGLWVGQYDSFPCAGGRNGFDGSVDDGYPFKRKHFHGTNCAERASRYEATGVNVSMPSIYPYESYALLHTNHQNFHTCCGLACTGDCHDWAQVSPNARSAMFWVPLEKYTSAYLARRPGDLIIPYVANFVNDVEGVDVAIPEWADVQALTKHVRLRGANGYFQFGEGSTYDFVRGITYAAWTSLDFLGTTLTVLNTATNKSSGLEWSAATTPSGDKGAIIISNLGNGTAWFSMPSQFISQGLPGGFYINPGQHRVYCYGDASCAGLGHCPYCGDDSCSPNTTCLMQWHYRTSCHPYDHCGDGTCQPSYSETAGSCPQDCAYCGDGICSSTEDYDSCSADCGGGVLACPHCGAPFCTNRSYCPSCGAYVSKCIEGVR